MKNKLKIFVVFFIFTIILSACTNEPSATIRDIDKDSSQLTVSVFIEDPTESINRFDVLLMDGSTMLVSATNIRETESLKGLWDITLPMSDIPNGSYVIIIEATLSDDSTIELTTETIAWP